MDWNGMTCDYSLLCCHEEQLTVTKEFVLSNLQQAAGKDSKTKTTGLTDCLPGICWELHSP